MSLSDRFRRGTSPEGGDGGDGGDDPSVIPLPAVRSPFDPFDQEAMTELAPEEGLAAPIAPEVSGGGAAPWRSWSSPEPDDTLPEVVAEPTIEPEAEAPETPEPEPPALEEHDVDDVERAEPAAALEHESMNEDAVHEEPVLGAGTTWDEPLGPPAPETSFTQTWTPETWDGPHGEPSSEPILESLTAALSALDGDTPSRFAAGPAEPVAEQEPEPAAPVAPPLAAPAFARSKFGAMRRDEPVKEPEAPAADAEARPGSIFAPALTPVDGPRATGYGLGDRSGAPDIPVDPLASLKKRVEEALLRRLGAKLADGELSEEELRSFVERELASVLANEQTALSKSEQEQIVTRLTDDLLGHGPMEQFLQDESVTEVMVSGLEPMYIERNGRIMLTDVRFGTEAQLRQVIERIVGRVGRRVDESSPMVDARLPDGSRVNAIIPPLAVDGPSLTIRKFSRRALTVDDLVASGSLNQNAADMLSACVRGRLNILVTGGTGSGKTTMLNVLSSFIPSDQRIVTIEDAVELRLNQHHVIRLEARPPNIEGKGQVTIRDLVRNSLRMRPDRIIVGEVRSGEALDMLQAMNTGHDGSLSTLHANQPRDALARLETMVLMAGFDLPVRAIREQMASAVDMIVHISRLRDGSRRVTHIVEVEGMEGEIITLTDLYLFDYSAGIDDAGRFRGELKATGLRPKFAERLADLGIDVPLPSVGFDPRGEIAVPAGFGWNR